MALHKATFTCTAGTNGYATDDDKLKGPSFTSRHAFIEAVKFDGSAASKVPTSVEFTQVELDGTIELVSNTVLFIPNPQDGVYYPRSTQRVVNEFGDAVTGSGRILVTDPDIRCTVYGPLTSAEVYTVTLYYETAGDYRF